ncbi:MULTISPECIES: tetratricopeptide repeat protein [Legionella]|uniref:Cytochrome c type biogenesis protein CcmH n=1 Tax=Legionella donaldsonii TaxID=45060 RepID=A0A378J2E8_9GAMM|nr:tetratricopeptide repeat protein [Legionella donaldsonii]STX41795.1 cytochrome c type biogenesis protein CcmH [Legionella donaldsonii]
MNEWWLPLCFITLVLLALPVALYPLRKTKWFAAVLAPIVIIGVAAAYWRWGAWSTWQHYRQETERQRRVEAVLQTIKSPTELVDRLKARLQANPDSARGWYLLGRLYVSQGQWQIASEAFAKAHQLAPNDTATTVNYGQSLWQLNQQRFDEPIRALFTNLLRQDPDQPDALAMLAMDSFMNHHYQQAINYWQHLLKLAPEQSEEAQMIRKAIAKAQQQLQE